MIENLLMTNPVIGSLAMIGTVVVTFLVNVLFLLMVEQVAMVNEGTEPIRTFITHHSLLDSLLHLLNPQHYVVQMNDSSSTGQTFRHLTPSPLSSLSLFPFSSLPSLLLFHFLTSYFLPPQLRFVSSLSHFFFLEILGRLKCVLTKDE